MSCCAHSFQFRPYQGVCDTPLHLFDWFPGFIGLRDDFNFAHIRAYAIRPYTCSIDFRVLLCCVMISISPASGRMRYAPTPVRLFFLVLLGCVFVPFLPTWGRMSLRPYGFRLYCNRCQWSDYFSCSSAWNNINPSAFHFFLHSLCTIFASCELLINHHQS